MFDLSYPYYFPYLASRLRCIFDSKGETEILFFNNVKFISLLARNMNGGSAYLSVSLSR